MPERTKQPAKPKRPTDVNQLANFLVRQSTENAPEEQDQLVGQSPVSAYLSQIGRLGGLKGGRVRADKLTKKRRKEIAQKAARARWKAKGKS